MIMELRHYTLKPGRREEFITFFEQYNRPALREAGMLVFGPMRDLDHADKVHWIRAFPSMKERERIKDGFYGGPAWHTQIEPKAMSMIDRYEAELVETTDGFETFNGSPALTG